MGWYNEAFLLYLAFNMTEPYSLIKCWKKVNEEHHENATPHLGPVTQLTWRSWLGRGGEGGQRYQIAGQGSKELIFLFCG